MEEEEFKIMLHDLTKDDGTQMSSRRSYGDREEACHKPVQHKTTELNEKLITLQCPPTHAARSGDAAFCCVLFAHTAASFSNSPPLPCYLNRSLQSPFPLSTLSKLHLFSRLFHLLSSPFN